MNDWHTESGWHTDWHTNRGMPERGMSYKRSRALTTY